MQNNKNNITSLSNHMTIHPQSSSIHLLDLQNLLFKNGILQRYYNNTSIVPTPINQKMEKIACLNRKMGDNPKASV